MSKTSWLKDWVHVPNAVDWVRDALSLSEGAAGAALCGACASGMVRWRLADPFVRPPSRKHWHHAHIDSDGNMVSGATRWEALYLRISAVDLLFWLQQQPNYTGPQAPKSERGRAGISNDGKERPRLKTGPKTNATENMAADLLSKLVDEKISLKELGQTSAAALAAEYQLSETTALKARNSAIAQFFTIRNSAEQ